MELSGEAWAAIAAVGTAIVGAVVFLIKEPLQTARKRAEEDASARQKRQEELEKHQSELSQLQKDYIKTATESSAINAATNAKQAGEIAAQTAHLHLMATAIASVSNKTDRFNEAFTKFVALGRMFIAHIPDKMNQDVAQKHLDEIVNILAHSK